MLERIERTPPSPRSPPRAPGEADSSAQVLPRKAASGGSSPVLRLAQSMAFLSSGVMALLYSGQAISQPAWSSADGSQQRQYQPSPEQRVKFFPLQQIGQGHIRRQAIQAMSKTVEPAHPQSKP